MDVHMVGTDIMNKVNCYCLQHDKGVIGKIKKWLSFVNCNNFATRKRDLMARGMGYTKRERSSWPGIHHGVSSYIVRRSLVDSVVTHNQNMLGGGGSEMIGCKHQG